MSLSRLPSKREVALTLVERSSVMIHLDPRVEGVIVPPWLKKQPQLLLQVGYGMAVPIPDLDFGEAQVSCTLSFNRQPFHCVLPWRAVYALVDEGGRGMVWPDDVPPEVVAAEQERNRKEQRAQLRAVPAEAPVSEPAAPKPEEAPPPAPRKRAARKPKAEGDPPPARKRQRAAATPTAEAPATASKPLARKRGAAKGRPSTAPEAASAEGPAGGRRPLPPYLRVVK